MFRNLPKPKISSESRKRALSVDHYRGVDLLAVGEGERVVAGHLLPLGGEGGAVALLHRLDVHAHGDEDR